MKCLIKIECKCESCSLLKICARVRYFPRGKKGKIFCPKIENSINCYCDF